MPHLTTTKTIHYNLASLGNDVCNNKTTPPITERKLNLTHPATKDNCLPVRCASMNHDMKRDQEGKEDSVNGVPYTLTLRESYTDYEHGVLETLQRFPCLVQGDE